jgi:hypothetical protein
MQDLFGGKKNLLASAVGAVGQGLHLLRWSDKQAEKAQTVQQQRDAFSDNVAKLFRQKDVRNVHWRDLQKIYQVQHREFFWECYWQHMTDLLLSKDAVLMLDLLAFWFDDGYSVLQQHLYLVPAFFLGFTDAIDHARKERRFAESARRIHECAQKKDQLFWYPLVQEYFIEPERKGRFLFSKHRA